MLGAECIISRLATVEMVSAFAGKACRCRGFFEQLRGVSGFAGSGPVNGFRGRPPMDLAPLS